MAGTHKQMNRRNDFEKISLEIGRSHHLRLELLEELIGGRSGARTFLVAVTPLISPSRTEHMILRIENARRGEKTRAAYNEACRTLQAPFIDHHVMEPVIGPIPYAGMTAAFYKLAGGSLLQYSPLSWYSTQSLLVGFYQSITREILDEFCLGVFSPQHPHDLLNRWLQNQTDRIAGFLSSQKADPDSEGIIVLARLSSTGPVQPRTLPNPLYYLRNREQWGNVRRINALTGPSHGDLHPGNILAHSGDWTFKKYFFIDFEHYRNDSFLFFDHRSLELGFLIERAGCARFHDWLFLVEVLAHPGSTRSAEDLSVDLSGLFTLLDAGTRGVHSWIEARHPDKVDDLLAQYLLAAAAAGLSLCNKESLSIRHRWSAFLYAAIHLDAVAAAFGACMPRRATQLPVSLQADSSEPMGLPKLRRKRMRWAMYVALTMALLTGIFVFKRLTRYSAVAPDFQPAWTEEPHPNASSEIGLYPLDSIPLSLPWFLYNGDGHPLMPLGDEGIVQFQLNSSKYIFFRAVLSDDEYTWAGLFLHRLPLAASVLGHWKARAEGDLILVLESQRSDVLEIGLKDEGGGEHKIVLVVRPGWAGYRIKLNRFKNVHMAELDQVILAYSHTVGSAGQNSFRIAALAIR